MNIHPALVHFPIALLILYALMELLSQISALRTKPWIEPLKAFLVIVGTIAAMAALATGETAEHAIADRSLRPLIQMHSFFAATSAYIFGFIGLVYLLRALRRQAWYGRIPQIIHKLFDLYLVIFDRGWLLALGAIVGLIAITITGGLGGAIVYGPNADPVVHAIYSLFF